MKKPNWKPILALLLLGLSLELKAAKALWGDYQNPDSLKLYLHTVDTSNLLYTNFGHTVIRINNLENGTDIVFNWGIFDPTDSFSFGVNFYSGILNYRLAVYPREVADEIYQSEGRKVWEDEILLSPTEKDLFLKRITENLKPENKVFPYQYFFNNCSTIPRDHMDFALSGQLKAETQDPTGLSFRDMVHSHFEFLAPVRISLAVLMNGRIDKIMSRWEKMFLPLSLRTEWLKFKRSDQSPLMREGSVIEEGRQDWHIPFQSYGPMIFNLLLGLFILWAGLKIPGPSPILRWLGLVGGSLALVCGLYGFVMPLNWVLSAHQDLHHNANMWFFWPMEWLVLKLYLRPLFKGEWPIWTPRAGRFFHRFAALHLVIIAVYALGQLGGIFTQKATEALLVFLPLSLMQYYVLMHLTRKKALYGSSDTSTAQG